MKNYICGGNKYVMGKSYILLPVEIEGLPKIFTFEGKDLLVKSSFHVSLVCVKNIEKENKELEEKIMNKFCEFVSQNEISFLTYKNEFRIAKTDNRETLIVMCEVSNLNKFFDELSEELHMEIPYPPTHVTLYTLQQDAGIGLNSFTELEEKSKIVEVSEEIKNILK